MMEKSKEIVVLFVEGETEKVFFNIIKKHLITNKSPKVKIINLKGIGRFETKIKSKLKNEIIPEFHPDNITVFFCYDTDVFDLARKPATSWKKVEKDVKDLGIKSYHHIKAKLTIEDWFILDLEGICEFLKIKNFKKKKSKSGLETMKELFKSAKIPKIYQKGSYTHKFLEKIDISKIINALPSEFKKLKELL